MSDFTAMKIGDMEAIYGGGFRRARASLGVTAFGLSTTDLPPNYDGVPAHSHRFDGQEELYVVVAGDGALEIEGDKVPVETGTLVRIAPGARRRPIAGPNGIRLLIAGAAPGKAYEPFENSELGKPEIPVQELRGVVEAAAGKAAGEDVEGESLASNVVGEDVEGEALYSVAKVDDIEALTGYFQGVSLTPVRRALGIKAFGVGVMSVEGEDAEYPKHDHSKDGQEEVYIPISGEAELDMGEHGKVLLTPGMMVRVAPEVTRTIVPGSGSVQVLALGGTPGAAYEPPQRKG
ncbi:MAG TPA: cupin domain-containing protein [Solirubrobacterales bacterium]|jgi:uncharacterized cupin superfamily protein|nr:cupin domain-containing protein [Solirubrobacterales bacterium]